MGRSVFRWLIPTVVMVVIIVIVFGLGLLNKNKPQNIDSDTAGTISYTGQEQISEQKDILESLISTVYFAFNANGESEVYDQLALSVDGPILTDLYLQQRRSLFLIAAEGTKVIVKSVQLLQAEQTNKDGNKVSFEANWQASGSVSHSEHAHDRVNRYKAVVSIAPVEGKWKIISLDLLDEQRIPQKSTNAEES